MQFKRTDNNRGVVLLYAVLLVSIVLTISLSLLNITYKQIILTAVNRESQIAHFNAWSAVDCVIFTNRFFGPDPVANPSTPYNELSGNPFGYFTYTGTILTGLSESSSDSFKCGEGDSQEIIVARTSFEQDGKDNITSHYKMTKPPANPESDKFCVIVDVVKVRQENESFDDYPNEPTMTLDWGTILISARGYNSVAPCQTNESNPRLVERQIRRKG